MKGESEAPGEGWGVGFLLKIPGGEGGLPKEGEGAEGLEGCLRGRWGGIFFSVPKFPARKRGKRQMRLSPRKNGLLPPYLRR